jgi:hypothetical protein
MPVLPKKGQKSRSGYKSKSNKSSKYSKSSNGIKMMKPVINPALKSYVKKLVNNTEEVKCFTQAVAYKANVPGTGFLTTAGTGFNSASSIIPVIYQGTGQNQRIGNKIRPVSFYVRGHILALPVNTTTNTQSNMPFYVRVVFWRQTANLTGLSNIQILDDGITAGGNDFEGTLDDLMVPFNRDRYTIGGSRLYKLQPIATTTTNTENIISKYPVSQFFKIKVPLPKVLEYNDTALDPSNARWYMSVGIVNFDSTTLVNTQIRCQVTAQGVLKYRDA